MEVVLPKPFSLESMLARPQDISQDIPQDNEGRGVRSHCNLARSSAYPPASDVDAGTDRRRRKSWTVSQAMGLSSGHSSGHKQSSSTTPFSGWKFVHKRNLFRWQLNSIKDVTAIPIYGVPCHRKRFQTVSQSLMLLVLVLLVLVLLVLAVLADTLRNSRWR